MVSLVENDALKFTGKKQDYGKKEMLSSLLVSSSSMTYDIDLYCLILYCKLIVCVVIKMKEVYRAAPCSVELCNLL